MFSFIHVEILVPFKLRNVPFVVHEWSRHGFAEDTVYAYSTIRITLDIPAGLGHYAGTGSRGLRHGSGVAGLARTSFAGPRHGFAGD